MYYLNNTVNVGLQLLNLAFVPAEDEALDEMFRSGYEDALCWVQQQSRASNSSDVSEIPEPKPEPEPVL